MNKTIGRSVLLGFAARAVAAGLALGSAGCVVMEGPTSVPEIPPTPALRQLPPSPTGEIVQIQTPEVTPSSTPTETPTPTSTIEPTVAPSPTSTATAVETSTPTPTETPVPTETSTPTPTETPVPTETPTPTKELGIDPAVEGLVIEGLTISDLVPFRDIPRDTAESYYIPESYQQKVPAEIQQAFQEVNPDERVLYVGEANRGLEMNAVLTTRDLFHCTIDGFGSRYAKDGGDIYYFTGEFEGVVPVEGSNEFYMVLKHPLNGRLMPARMNLELEDGNNTGVGIQKLLSPPEEQDEFRGLKWRFCDWFSKGHRLEEIARKGDVVTITTVLLDRTKAERDHRGILLARGFAIKRGEGYEELLALFED